MRAPTLIPLAAALLLAACTKSEAPPAAPDPPPSAAAPAATPTPTPTAAPMVIKDAQGQVILRITPREAGAYRLEDAKGEKIGKITVEPDRVKVKDASDAPRAKVKKKDNGFKLYAADEQVVFKGKLSGESKLKLKREDETEIGAFEGAAGHVGGVQVAARPVTGGVEVSVGGQVKYTIEGAIGAEPAALLAAPDLDLYQQAALLIFVKEVW